MALEASATEPGRMSFDDFLRQQLMLVQVAVAAEHRQQIAELVPSPSGMSHIKPPPEADLSTLQDARARARSAGAIAKVICVCGNQFLDDSRFCRKCGTTRPNMCSCGNIMKEDSMFCRSCGKAKDEGQSIEMKLRPAIVRNRTVTIESMESSEVETRPSAPALRNARVSHVSFESSIKHWPETADEDVQRAPSPDDDHSVAIPFGAGVARSLSNLSSVSGIPESSEQDELGSLGLGGKRKLTCFNVDGLHSDGPGPVARSGTGRASLLQVPGRPSALKAPKQGDDTDGDTGRRNGVVHRGSQDRPRASACRSYEENTNYEVSLAWQFGVGSTRRQSVGGARLQLMDHFIEEDEQSEQRLRRAQTRGVNKVFSTWVGRPSSSPRLAWELCGLILIIHDSIMIPLEAFSPPMNMSRTVIVWIICLFWSANIVVSFLTGFMREDGEVEMEWSKVARHYCRGWLLVDVFVSGFDWIGIFFAVTTDAGDDSSGLKRFSSSWLRILRALKTVRLLRMLKAPEIAKKISDITFFAEWLGLFATMMKLMFGFLWIAHLVACMWYAISDFTCAQAKCWIEQSSVKRDGWGKKYVLSMHWSLMALSGDTGMIMAENPLESVYGCMILYVAFLVAAIYVGSITATMNNIQLMASEQSSKLAVLRRFLLDHGIGHLLATRVQRNAQHALLEYKSKAPEATVELLTFISQPLLVEVHFDMYSKPLLEHPFFSCYSNVNPAGIRKVCHTAIRMLSLHTKDVLFRDLEVAANPQTYFVVSGKLQYMHDMKVDVITEKMWLCEHALWTSWAHIGTARAMTETRLLCLDAEKWQETINVFPTDHASDYATEFVKWLNMDGAYAGGEPRNDLGPNHETVLNMLVQAFPLESDDEESDEGETYDTGAFVPKRVSVASTMTKRKTMSVRTSSMAPNKSWVAKLKCVLDPGDSWLPSASRDPNEKLRHELSSQARRHSHARMSFKGEDPEKRLGEGLPKNPSVWAKIQNCLQSGCSRLINCLCHRASPVPTAVVPVHLPRQATDSKQLAAAAPAQQSSHGEPQDGGRMGRAVSFESFSDEEEE